MTIQLLDLSQCRLSHTWMGVNFNLPADLTHSKDLAERMYSLSQNNPYACSLSQYENFCQQCFSQPNSECFFATFVIHVHDILIGFLNVRVIFSDIEIDFLCIDCQYRKKGLAENLFKEFYQFIKEKGVYQRILLEVGIENKPAFLLYEKLGFTQTYLRKKYYSHGEDAAVMESILS